jgi:hypothetical protein
METWVRIPNYEDHYFVSNYGNVKSIDRLTADGRHVKGKVLKPVVRPDGYLQISRYMSDGKQKIELVHRLVASAFLGEIPDGYVVDHIDRNRANNNINNLRYILKKENDGQGGKTQGKKVIQLDKCGDIVGKYLSVSDAHRKTGINHGDICRSCNGKRKTAGGFCWRYV